MSSLRRVRIAAWAACAGLLVALALSTLFAVNLPSLQRSMPLNASGTAAIGGPFKLVDHNGRKVTDLDFKGRALVVFFGFTFCPDICPTTLNDLTTMMADLGPTANAFQVLFVSVDHERDTPEKLKDYMTAFDPRILALSGTAAEIATAARSYRVHYEKIDQAGGLSYTMDHTGTVFLMDNRHRFAGTIDRHADRKVGVTKLKRLVSD